MDARKPWIDIPISNSEPAKLALLSRFFVLHEFEYHETSRLLLVPTSEAKRLADTIAPWAYEPDLPEDDRHVETLASTQREIGDTVIAACAVVDPEALPKGMVPVSLDLR